MVKTEHNTPGHDVSLNNLERNVVKVAPLLYEKENSVQKLKAHL